MALNAYGSDGFECLWEWWLWMPMRVIALNTYENDGSESLWNWWLWTPMKMMALNTYENGGFERLWEWWLWMPMEMMKKKINNLYTGDMPQYQSCIKLLKCWMKQVAANIVMRKKQHIVIKVSRSINTNLFMFQINSLSIDLKHKAQQIHITIWKKNNYSENKPSHKLLIRESINAF